jgi:hypothetical protein
MGPREVAQAESEIRRLRKSLDDEATELLRAMQGIPTSEVAALAFKGSMGRKRALDRIRLRIPFTPMLLTERYAVWRFVRPTGPLLAEGTGPARGKQFLVSALVVGLARGQATAKIVPWGMSFCSHAIMRLLYRSGFAADPVQAMLQAHDAARAASAECARPMLAEDSWAIPAAGGAFLATLLPMDDGGDTIVVAQCGTWIGQDQFLPCQEAQVAALRYPEPGRTLGDGLLQPAPLRGKLRAHRDAAGPVNVAM